MKSNLSGKSLIIIIDPACYPNNGHNIDSCLRFSDKYQKNHEDLVFYISGNPKKIINKGLNVNLLPKIYFELYIGSFKNRYYNGIYWITYKLFKSILGKIIDKIISLIVKTKVNIIFKQTEKYEKTAIFFPSCDYYYAKAVLEKMENSSNDIELNLRFIGVMEHASNEIKKSENKLFRLIKNSKAKIKITTETNKYSFLLTNIIGINTSVEPYPIKKYETRKKFKNNKYTPENPLKIALPGKPRIDKGNLDLPIFLDISLRKLGMRAIFYTTSLKNNSKLKKMEKKIFRYPNIVVFENPLPDKEFREFITQTDIILMPYDIKTYWYRGSAIFFESIEKGKLVYARSGCAFSDDMSKIGAINTFPNIENFIDSISYLLNEGPDYVEKLAKKNMNAYCSWYEKNENFLSTSSLP